MIHQAFKKPAFIANGTTYNLPGIVRVKFSGGLTYVEGGSEYCAWEGGYLGEDRASGPPAPWPNRWQVWNPARLDRFAATLTDPYLALNIEHYGADGLGRLVDIIERIRARRPDIAIGTWSLLPKSMFWTVKEYAEWIDYQAGRPHFKQLASWWKLVGPTREAAYFAWQRENDAAARKLVPHVDFLMPSCYPVTEPIEKLMWTAAREPELMISECRRVAPTLPVIASYYAFVASTKKVASPLLTQTILNACKAADARVIWGDPNTPETVVADAFASQTQQSSSES